MDFNHLIIMEMDGFSDAKNLNVLETLEELHNCS